MGWRFGDHAGAMKKRMVILLSGLVGLMGMSGCLQVESVISLRKDGSGTITEEIVMGAQMVQMMESGLGGAGAQNPFAELLDEDQYKKKAAGYGQGVTFSKVEKIERNGGKGARVTYRFKDINTVRFSPGSAMQDFQQGMPGAEADPAGPAGPADQPVTFKFKGNKLTMHFPEMPERQGEEKPAPEIPAEPQAEAMMIQMFKDMKVGARLVVEPGIEKTNATHVEGNTITLMEMNFGEIVSNPDGIKALQKMDQPGREELKKNLKGLKGVKLELEETVEVSLK